MSKATIDYQIFDVEGINDAPNMILATRQKDAERRSLERIEAQRRNFEAQMEEDYLMDSINRNHVEARARAEEKTAENGVEAPVAAGSLGWQVLVPVLGILGVFLLGVALAGILAGVL